MTLLETKSLAIALMREHGLIYDGWTFAFDNARNRAGVCRHGKKIIGLSKYLLPYMKPEKVKDTLLHEIAHAMVGAHHGHDIVWQRQAISIGCNGARCYSADEDFNAGAVDELAVRSKYVLTCPSCGSTKSDWITVDEMINQNLGTIPDGYQKSDFDYLCLKCEELIKK